MVHWEWFCLRFRQELTARGSRSSWGCKPGWECPEWLWGDQNSPFPWSRSGCRKGEALLCISLARDELQRSRAAARPLQQLLKVAWGTRSGAEIKISLEMKWPRPQSGCRKLVVIPCSLQERFCVLEGAQPECRQAFQHRS